MCSTCGFFLRALSEDYYEVERFSLPSNREFIIWGESFWEISQAFYYEVHDTDRIVVPRRYFANGPGDTEPRFAVKWSKDGDVVACFNEDEPDKYLCIYEFSTGVGVPWGGNGSEIDLPPYEKRDEMQRIILRLAARLRQ